MKTTMKQMKNTTMAHTATQLIVRLDQNQKPLVFVADSLSNGNMLAWKPNTTDAIVLPLDAYKSTVPVDDERAVARLVNKFSKTFNNPNVQLRHRLFRNYDKETGNAPVYPIKVQSSPHRVRTNKMSKRQAAATLRYQQEVIESNKQAPSLSDRDIKRIAEAMVLAFSQIGKH